MPCDRAGYLNGCGEYGTRGGCDSGYGFNRVNDARLLKKELHYVETYFDTHNEECADSRDNCFYDGYGGGCGGCGYDNCGGCGFNGGRGFGGGCGFRGFDGGCGFGGRGFNDGFGYSPCDKFEWKRGGDDKCDKKKKKKKEKVDDSPCNPFCKPCYKPVCNKACSNDKCDCKNCERAYKKIRY